MITRRHLLAGAAPLIAGSGFLSALSAFPARAANVDGYKALVCVFLRGGLDCHDTILPIDQASYDRYGEIRRSLLEIYADREGASLETSSRAQSQLMELEADNAEAFGGRAFGVPPQLAALHALFQSGQAAVVGNVGPLIAPANRTQVKDRTVPLPTRLFSHNDQQSTWASSAPEGARIGWGGRFADAVSAAGANGDSPFTAISLSGNAVFLSGDDTRPFQMHRGGVQEIRELRNRRWRQGRDAERVSALLQEHFRAVGDARENLFEYDVVDANVRSIEANRAYNAARDGAPELSTGFPRGALGERLQRIAEAIAAREALGVRRQVFFAAMDKYDTHSDQVRDLPGLQSELARCIAAFHSATQEMGVENEVTLFTASEFGRTLVVNGDGTDHGWGGHQFVVGGAVDGRKIFGQIPPYDLDHAMDSDHGRLIPGLAVEQYAASLGRWFGLGEEELAAALPGLVQFDAHAAPFV